MARRVTNIEPTNPEVVAEASLQEEPKQVISMENNKEALAVLDLGNNKYRLIAIPFDGETLKVGKPIVLAEEDNFNEISDRFRIEAAKRDFA